jgi:hypothetical protein
MCEMFNKYIPCLFIIHLFLECMGEDMFYVLREEGISLLEVE